MVGRFGSAGRILDAVGGLATLDELSVIQLSNGDATTSHAVSYAGVRALYGVLLRLAEADLATAPRYDLQPWPESDANV